MGRYALGYTNRWKPRQARKGTGRPVGRPRTRRHVTWIARPPELRSPKWVAKVMRKVEQREDGHWHWLSTWSSGAPRYSYWSVRRLTWWMNGGEIPLGHRISVTCDDPECINPQHMRCANAIEGIGDKAPPLPKRGYKLNRDDWD